MKKTLRDIVDFNRKTLLGIDCFLDDSVYLSSPDNYGLPPRVRHFIDKPINDELTYVDLIMYLQTFFNKGVGNYIEIGVSVLKSFYQVSSFLNNCDLYAFDINKINPIIESRFSLKEEAGQIKKYDHNTNRLTYFQGDVFSKKDLYKFNSIIGKKFNIVFSDAHHSYGGLIAEYSSFIKGNLDEEFILYYDDLDDSQTRKAFKEISDDIKSKRQASAGLVRVNGWLGQYEPKHTNGIITSLEFKQIAKDNKIKFWS